MSGWFLVCGLVSGAEQKQQEKTFFYPFVLGARCLDKLLGKVMRVVSPLEGTAARSEVCRLSDLPATMSLCRLCLPPHLFVSHLSIFSVYSAHSASCKTEKCQLCTKNTQKKNKRCKWYLCPSSLTQQLKADICTKNHWKRVFQIALLIDLI